MPAVSGYRTDSVLYQGPRVTIYRAVRLADGSPVVLKCLERPRDGSSDLARFRREFEIGRRLNGPGTATVLSFEPGPQGPTLVMADSGGVSVAHARQHGGLELSDILHIGAAVAAALDRIHAGHVIHKDVTPANIVWNRATGTVELIDFSIAAELARETSPSDIDQLEGTLAYIAPEQTGRMNRSLDWRCDFYSLGATLYDLLTGRAPFEGGDALSVIHGHIARVPVPPNRLDPAIPPAVSAIVLKLMAKDPEQRYQSAQGIAADLETCRSALAETGSVADFRLAARDVSPRFHIPEKLYGREADIARLLESFEAVAGGASRLLLINGPPGIGKSALVQELQGPLMGRRGFFPQGKYEQFKRNIPYSGLVQAFQHLARRLLAETERLRSALLNSLSHDLRTPLSSILAAATSLQRHAASYDAAARAELAGLIQSEAERMNRFVNNLLDMTRIESGALLPKQEIVDLADVVGTALEGMSRLLTGHRTEVDIPADLPMINGDFMLLEQVLLNLLDNAAKYAAGGVITLTGRRREDRVVLTVADEGPGIDPDRLSRIFDKFYRVHAGDRQRAGTGLGLAICQGFVEAMGGTITADNRLDRSGAVFTIILPAGLEMPADSDLELCP